jgi:hypothetical protein
MIQNEGQHLYFHTRTIVLIKEGAAANVSLSLLDSSARKNSLCESFSQRRSQSRNKTVIPSCESPSLSFSRHVLTTLGRVVSRCLLLLIEFVKRAWHVTARSTINVSPILSVYFI